MIDINLTSQMNFITVIGMDYFQRIIYWRLATTTDKDSQQWTETEHDIIIL